MTTFKLPNADKVNHPKHYTSGGLETLDILKAKMSHSQYEGFLRGNILKYIIRYPHKNDIEDLKKAQFYLIQLIDEKEGLPF